MSVTDDDSGKTQLDDEGVPIPPRLVEKTKMKFVLPENAELFSLVVHDPIQRKEFVLKPGENILGRDKTCDIFLDDPSVSRNHATITVASKVVSMKDLGSKNGTYIKGQKVNYEVEILPGTEVRFGNVRTMLSKKPD